MNWLLSLVSAVSLMGGLSSEPEPKQKEYIAEMIIGNKLIPLQISSSWDVGCNDIQVDEQNQRTFIQQMVDHLTSQLSNYQHLMNDPKSASLNNEQSGATYTLTILSKRSGASDYNCFSVDFDSSSLQMSTTATIGTVNSETKMLSNQKRISLTR